MTVDPDILIADIIQTFMSIPAGRVVVYDENYEPPKDSGLYAVVLTTANSSIGINQWFDDQTNESVTESSVTQEITIRLTSKDRSALTRKEEVFMALASDYSQQKQQDQICKISRKGEPIDLSFIEASRALKRFDFQCTVFYLKVIRKPSSYFNVFKETSEVS